MPLQPLEVAVPEQAGSGICAPETQRSVNHSQLGFLICALTRVMTAALSDSDAVSFVSEYAQT